MASCRGRWLAADKETARETADKETARETADKETARETAIALD